MKKTAFAVGILLISSSVFAEGKVQKIPGKNCVPHFENGNHAGYTCSDEKPAEKPINTELQKGQIIRASDMKIVTDADATKPLPRKEKQTKAPQETKATH